MLLNFYRFFNRSIQIPIYNSFLVIKKKNNLDQCALESCKINYETFS